jgi:hypothetical protein
MKVNIELELSDIICLIISHPTPLFVETVINGKLQQLKDKMPKENDIINDSGIEYTVKSIDLYSCSYSTVFNNIEKRYSKENVTEFTKDNTRRYKDEIYCIECDVLCENTKTFYVSV